MKQIIIFMALTSLMISKMALAEDVEVNDFDFRQSFHSVQLGVRLAPGAEPQQATLYLNRHMRPQEFWRNPKEETHYLLYIAPKEASLERPFGIWIRKSDVFNELKKYHQMILDDTHRRTHLLLDAFDKHPRIWFNPKAPTGIITQAYMPRSGGGYSWKAGGSNPQANQSGGGVRAVVGAVRGCFNPGGRR